MADQSGTPTATPQTTQPTQPITHTVGAGDTLSSIGAKYGVNWQDIYQANRGIVGPNPNLIRPGQVLQIPGQSQQPTGNTTNFKLDIPATIPSTTFQDAMTNPITAQDLQDAIASNKELTSKIAGEELPTTNETNLNSQLSDIRAQEDQAKLGLRKYENALPEEGISAGAIKGRSMAMARNVNLDLQTMALQEKNLMARLGIETATRKGNLAADQATQKGNEKTITDFESFQRIIDTQKNQVAAQAAKLQTSARTTLDSILTHLKGYDYQDLSPDSQKQISDLATNAGVPLETVIDGLAANKSQVQLNTLQKQNTIAKQDQSLNGTGKTVTSGKLRVTDTQIGELSSALESHKGSDGYADTSVYVKALDNWVSNGGLAKDFYAKFPPKQYLNPNDSTVPANLKSMLPKSSTTTTFK